MSFFEKEIKSYSTYSGADTLVTTEVDGKIYIIGEFYGFDYAVKKESETDDIKTLGTFICTSFDTEPFVEMHYRTTKHRVKSSLEVPPFDLIVYFLSDVSSQITSRLVIKDVRIVVERFGINIDTIQPLYHYSFRAQSIDTMKQVAFNDLPKAIQEMRETEVRLPLNDYEVTFEAKD